MTNSQITDAVRLAQLFTINMAATQSQAMLNAVMTETIGMTMHNAVSAQRSNQMLATAAMTATCAKILSIPVSPTATTNMSATTSVTASVGEDAHQEVLSLVVPQPPPQSS